MPPAQGSQTNSSPPAPPDRGNSGRRNPSYYNQNNRNSGGGGPNGGYSRPRKRSYSYPAGNNESKRQSGGGGSPKITLVMAVYRGASQGFKTVPVTFDRNRTTDTELWEDIRAAYREDLHNIWRRFFLFTTLKAIAPIEFTRNDVPKRTDPKNVPGEAEFMHAYHHPDHLRTPHSWIDWFVDYRSDPDKTYGLEFVEGLWADKLALIAVALTIVIIAVSVVWCLKGGNLQTVFTVMGFVLTGVAAELALLALYYQFSSSLWWMSRPANVSLVYPFN